VSLHNSPRPSLILASTSPRRQEFLRNMGLSFRIVAPLVEEIPKPGEAILDYVLRNAREKAQWVADHEHVAGHEHLAVIGADTIVMLGTRLLEKPRDATEAYDMLRFLSGKTHTVQTAMVLRMVEDTQVRERSEIFSTEVTFRPLSDGEIYDYIETGEPMDKSGAYGIQADRASSFVTEIRGSYSSVRGLPLAQLHMWLAAEGFF
jgi:septum formation protein